MSTVTMDLTTQRKMIAILKIIHESHTPLGARLIADRMNSQGYVLGERAVRYHLRILDERHLTKRIGYDGRVITNLGIAEIDNALVGDRVGFIITKIERLMLDTSFDLKTRQGNVIINISVIEKDDLEKSMEIIKTVINGYPFSPYIKILEENSVISDIEIMKGKIGIATMCSITIDGILLKNGITSDPIYGGIMEVKDNKPVCFEDVIVYSGTTIDPMRIFIKKKMTRVLDTVNTGSGKLLANLREIPGSALSRAKEVLDSVAEARIGGIARIGAPGESVLNSVIGAGKAGIVVYAGTNVMAAVSEMGIKVATYPISAVIDFRELKEIS
ncbi:MAG: NrpR regulatory domain-containing protein [Candidatus Methanoperedens sp.]|nr:NrpR regulatory domain-containing protein [Candidatus Methanoperedens sp.]